MDGQPMSDEDARSYLERIGADRPRWADADALRMLHGQHLHTVPFENLSIHLREPIVLDRARLHDKIVGRRRGGFCFELNGLFAELLRTLGFGVSLLAGRVFTEEGELGPPGEHLALWVRAGEPWLVDVGFGRNALHPLRLNADGTQHDPDGEFTVAPTADGDLDLLRGGVRQYRVETRPRQLSDFRPLCYFMQYSPDSHFTRSLVCTIRTGEGRVTLSGNQLITTIGEQRDERTLAEDELLDAYREYFGIVLGELPKAPGPAGG